MQKYLTIHIVPSIWQFVIDEIMIIILCTGCYVYAGMDELPCQPMSLGIAILLSIYLTYRLIWYRNLTYFISDEQIIIEYGVFNRDRSYMELFRVIDFHEKKSFLQLLLGLKTISIYSGDRTSPRVDIIGIARQGDMVGVIRDRVTYSKRMHGIYEITNR